MTAESYRMKDGHRRIVHTADSSFACGWCGEHVGDGDLYTLRKRRSPGVMRLNRVCVERCDPIAEKWVREVPDSAGNSIRFQGNEPRKCGYCETTGFSVKLRQKIDPKTFRVAHTMLLCSRCAQGSGYTEIPHRKGSSAA